MARRAQPTSLRAYARRRGVSAEAVSKAVSSGRLRESVTQVRGAPKIADVDIADREWEANTRPSVDRTQKVDPTDALPDYHASRALREAAAARREAALADLAEIEVAEKREQLVTVDEARSYMINKFTLVKTRILGVPSRVAQQLPHLATEVAPVVEALLREVLEELAADDDGDGEEEAA